MDERRKYHYARKVYHNACKIIAPLIKNQDEYGFDLGDACAQALMQEYPDMEIEEMYSIVTSAIKHHAEGRLDEILSKSE